MAKTRDLTPALRRKKRLRKRRIITMPTTPQLSTDSPLSDLVDAYPIAIYWDNDENAFIAELSSFNSARLHAASWIQAANAAKTAHTLLITLYRANGYTLPEVG